jgi:hypothetical protein
MSVKEDVSRLRHTVIGIALSAVVLFGCGPGPEDYETVLDQLPIPLTWELVYLTVSAPGAPDISADPRIPRKLIDCAICMYVGREYLVDAEPVDIYPVARRFLVDVGYTLESDPGGKCDRPPGSAACLYWLGTTTTTESGW